MTESLAPSLVAGGGDGRPVLLVHGNSMAVESFGDLLEGFGALGRAQALELPGHGSRAEETDAATFPGHLEDVRRAVDSLGAGVVVVGHSLGGHLALEQVDHEAVAGVVAIGAPPIRSTADFGAAFHPTALFQAELTDAELHATAEAVCPPEQDRVAQWIRGTRPSARAELAGSLGTGAFRDEVALVREAEVPVALILGEEDRLVNADFVDGIGLAPHLWGGAVHRVAGASHLPMLDASASLRDLLEAFLGDLD